jgi:ATP-dependent exoDNAse (exonuclease V) beta subunit
LLTNQYVLENKNFTVYKSSAGSGKTYTLVREYIALALKYKRPDDLKHILAITFTNKAAAEMKERIVSTLHAFCSGEPKGAAALMFEDLAISNKVSKQELQQRAQAALDFILHHYSDFAVSTIDKFNHKIIRSFAFDLRLPVNFELETDIEDVLQNAVDELLEQSGKNETLTKVLLAYIEDLLQDEKSWNIGKELMDFGHQLFNEDIAQKIDALKSLDLEGFLSINKKLNTFMHGFKEQVTVIGNQAIDLLETNNVDHSNLAGGASAGIGKYFTYLSGFRDDKLQASNTVKKNFESGKLTAGKASGQEKMVIENMTNELVNLFHKSEKILEEQFEKYKLYKLIKANLFSVAVLNEMEKIVLELKQKNNILFISEFNKIISDAIANEPAPYIYERLGERYRHFLIDEFQDTSIMQWRNILPLVHNSLSQGFFNMIVGDAKQSIYRWRNGEVEQFVKLPDVFSKEDKSMLLVEQEQSLKSNHHPKVLETNFRSKVNIINFNNSFFEYLRNATAHDFSDIYNQAGQKVAANKEGGSVNICQFDGERADRDQWTMDRVIDAVKLCLAKGYHKKDIAIITRGNADGANVAAQLMEQNIDVISKESLLLNTSAEVRFIIELLKFIDNSANEICIASIRYFLIQHQNFKNSLNNTSNTSSNLYAFFKENEIDFSTHYLKSLPLFELVIELSIMFDLNAEPNAYLKFFMDQIFGFGQHTSSISDLLTWWDNKQHKFSIVVPDGVDAVNVMTIHKSKGLQFPIVIIPYADLTINTKGIKHWTALDEPDFPELKYALLNHGELLSDTSFANIHEEEGRKIILDQLNMLYVAFTRPEEHLFIISANRRNSMHPYINQFVEKQQYNTQIINGVNYFSLGIIDEVHVKNAEIVEAQSVQWFPENKSWKDSLKVSGYNLKDDLHQAQLTYGNMIHFLLAEINHPNEINLILEKYEINIAQSLLDKEVLKNKLLGVFKLPAIQPYFDGSYLLKKEASILNDQGELMRPDLIAIKDKTAAIIDYKTGEPRTTYAEQLAGYSALLNQMGYDVKTRLIVYVDNEEVESV